MTLGNCGKLNLNAVDTINLDEVRFMEHVVKITVG
jgi:hypothetical protein